MAGSANKRCQLTSGLLAAVLGRMVPAFYAASSPGNSSIYRKFEKTTPFSNRSSAYRKTSGGGF
jgi:hypothetical protein